MKIKKLLSLAAALVLTTGMSAQTDVTSTYITNADFASTDGWTQYVSSGYKDIGYGLIGTYKIYGNTAATVDATHLATEYCFGFECRWAGNYSSYNQTTSSSLPAGVYTLTYDVENVNGGTTKGTYNNLFYVKVGEATYADASTEWMNGKSSWTTHTVSFTLNEAAPATISLGYGTGSNNYHVNNTPYLYVSHLKLTYQSFLEIAKAAWQEAKEAAETAYSSDEYTNVFGAEWRNLKDEIDKAEPTTQEDYEAATKALTDATDAFTAAKPDYDTMKAIAKYVGDNYDTALPYASAAKYQALQDAVDATEPENVDNAAEAKAAAEALTTALRTYVESNAMAEGVDGAVNKTSLIVNPDASNGNNGWTINGSMNNPASNQPWTDADGTNTHSYFDGGNWGAKSWTTTMEQTIALPAGKYYLTAKERAAENVTFTMEAAGESVDMIHVGGAGGVFNNGWNDKSVEFTTDGSASVVVKVTATTTAQYQWFSISDFRLVRLELHEELATAEDYQALEAAVSDAEEVELGFDKGEYAPYNNIAQLQAIAAAKAVDKEAENPKAAITDLIEAITTGWTPNTEEVNAIFDGQFATTSANTTTGDISLPGWTKVQGIRLLVKDTSLYPGLEYTDGKAAVFSWGGTVLTYGEQLGYTLPLNQGETYELKLKVSGWVDGDMPNVVKVNLDGQEKTVDAAALGAKAINTADGNPFVTLSFRLKASAEGDSKLTIYSNHHFTIADLSLMLAGPAELDEAADNTAVEAEENAKVKVKRTIKQGYNTVVLPFDLTAEQVAAAFGEGAEVYTFSDKAEGEDVVISFQKAEAISANVPVVVKATVASTEQTFEGVNLVKPAAEPKAEGTALDFVGTYAPITVAAGDYFVNSGTLYKSSGATNMKAFRAYLTLKAGTDPNAVKLRIGGDTTTAIDAINAGAQILDGAVYNLSGQRVSQPTKGIYIINGKKVMMK